MAELPIFMQSVSGRHNTVPGSPISMPPNLNIQGIPGLQGPGGAMAMMMLEPALQGIFGPGFMPGQFQPTHNMYDHYRRRAQFQSMQTTMSAASESDQTQYTSMIRGMAATAGVNWNADRERAARMMASDMSKISPMLAQMMPDTFDQMHGSRGSATMMAQSMFQGGRYRMDPVTRMLGTSADSSAAMAKEVYERLYGPGADISAMKGFGAGRTGQMFDEMSRRGLMTRSMSRDEQMSGMARQDLASRGVTGSAAEAQLGAAVAGLQNLASPQLEAKIRQFESGRVSERLKSMAGAVAAMKDVFGEMGRPDAPMNELIEGLQVITQGGLATMAPGRIEQLVRDTSNIARRSGMGMDNVAMLMASSSQRADAMGLDRVFGVTAGMQAATFGTAYANTVGGHTAWGRGDRDRMTAVDAQLRVNAAASPVANEMAATMRLGSEVGFKANSEAALMYKALQDGKTEYTAPDGTKKSVYAKQGQWRSIMADGGVDLGLVSAYRAQTAYNQKTIDSAGLSGLARQLQSTVDVAPRLDLAFQQAGRSAGITDRTVLNKLGAAASSGLLNDIPAENLQDPTKVSEYLAGKLGIDKNDASKMAQLRHVASTGWGNIEQMVKLSPQLRGYKTGDQFVLAHRKETLALAAREADASQQEGRLQNALAGITGSPLERLVDAVSEATPGTKFNEILQNTLGWVPQGAVGAKLEGTVKAMQAEIATFHGTDKKDVREAALAKIKSMSPEMRKQAEQAGLSIGAMATSGDAAAAWRAVRDGRGASMITTSDSLTDKILYDDRSMALLDAGGMSLVKSVQGRNTDLRRLAALHSGGDVGALTATDEQRKQALNAYSVVAGGSAESKSLEAQIRAAESTGDVTGANKLREKLEDVNKKVSEAQGKLNRLGSDTGTTGEKLATSKAVPDSVKAEVEGLRRGQLGDLESIQRQLRESKHRDLTDAEKKSLEAERTVRRKPNSQVLREAFKALGLEGRTTAADRDALSAEMTGDRGTAIRAALPALQRLRELKTGMTNEQFQSYLRAGLGAGASAEEKSLYHQVSGGKAGGGLAGVGRDSGREAVRERLRDYASWQKDDSSATSSKKTPGTKDVQEITGTLVIPGLGEGRLTATGGGRK